LGHSLLKVEASTNWTDKDGNQKRWAKMQDVITKPVHAGFTKNKADEALFRHKIVTYELIWITFLKGRKRHNSRPLLPIWNMTPLLQQDPRIQLHVVVQYYKYSKYCMGSTSAGISEGCDPEYEGDNVKGKQ
jgi:hypothetical protein